MGNPTGGKPVGITTEQAGNPRISNATVDMGAVEFQVPMVSLSPASPSVKEGAERSTRKARVLSRLDALTRQVPVLYPQNPAICRHHAEQFTRLREAGTPMGGNDLWIACHALAEGATLITHNLREFQRVHGLRVEDWVG